MSRINHEKINTKDKLKRQFTDQKTCGSTKIVPIKGRPEMKKPRAGCARIPAPKDGECRICKKAIEQGQMIMRDLKKRTRIYCIGC